MQTNGIEEKIFSFPNFSYQTITISRCTLMCRQEKLEATEKCYVYLLWLLSSQLQVIAIYGEKKMEYWFQGTETSFRKLNFHFLSIKLDYERPGNEESIRALRNSVIYKLCENFIRPSVQMFILPISIVTSIFTDNVQK